MKSTTSGVHRFDGAVNNPFSVGRFAISSGLACGILKSSDGNRHRDLKQSAFDSSTETAAALSQ